MRQKQTSGIYNTSVRSMTSTSFQFDTVTNEQDNTVFISDDWVGLEMNIIKWQAKRFIFGKVEFSPVDVIVRTASVDWFQQVCY